VNDPFEYEADRIADQVMAPPTHRAVGGGLPRIQRYASQATDSARTAAPASVDRVLASPGRPLEPSLRQDMEHRFGSDFSRVRVHSGAVAEQSARDVNAYAYTVGPDIVFGAGRLAPQTQARDRLLAHELTHVIQQTGGAPGPGVSSPTGLQCDAASPDDVKQASPRFEGDARLESISAGVTELASGASGLTVAKLQQALVDLGYMTAANVTRTFDPATKAALIKFQQDKLIVQSGKLDSATMKEFHKAYDTLSPYIANAKNNPLVPGTRTLAATEKTAALNALVPAPVAGAPSTFKEDLGPPKGKYGPRIKSALTTLIAGLHKKLFEDKKPLRADPGKNFFSWSALEAPAKAAKDVVDKLYGSNYGGPSAKPAMTHAGGNLIDQWTDEVATNAGLTAAQQKDKASQKVEYLIDSNCDTINHEHSAVPSAPAEKAIITPIIASFVASPTAIQVLLDLDIGWRGAQLLGKVYLQRFKSADPNAAKAKEVNRVGMWKLFQTCIHEYIHTLAHPDFNTWARTFRAAGDNTRYNALTEGFDDFFTLNVRKTVVPTTVQATVEGPFANGNPPAPDTSGVYPSVVQAEQVVAIVGIKNAQAGYFGGKTKLLGAP